MGETTTDVDDVQIDYCDYVAEGLRKAEPGSQLFDELLDDLQDMATESNCPATRAHALGLYLSALQRRPRQEELAPRAI